MLIRRATLPDGRIADVRVSARIDEVGDGLPVVRGEEVFDAAGGTVLPGLHDHHVHLRSAASTVGSLALGPPDVHTEEHWARALSRAAPGPDGWIRAVGYHESVAGEIDRTALDAVVPRIPVRVQHRSGALWILNSSALDLIGLSGHPDGRLRATEPRLQAVPRRDVGLAELGALLVAFGVTGVTDATPDLGAGDMESIRAAHRRGEFAPRVRFLSPGKRILHDDRLDLEELIRWIVGRHADGHPVALHCVTAAQLVVAMAALRAAGRHPGDRVEHVAVARDDEVAELAGLGITVVTQPNFVAERGDQYRAEIPAAEHAQLWRVESLLKAGVRVAFSTDMPFGRPDPWAAMRAAVRRTTPGGAVLGPGERVPPRDAVRMFLGSPGCPSRPRTVDVGQPGDLCVLTEPPEAVLAELDAGMVAATVIGGRVAYPAR